MQANQEMNYELGQSKEAGSSQTKDIQSILEEVLATSSKITGKGELATYIPELAKANPQDLGICLKTCKDESFTAGIYNKKFTIQSIAKVAALLLALKHCGSEKVFSIVGMEPSGAPFSEFTTLGDFSNKPSNPFINSGAIAISSLLATHCGFAEFLDFLRLLCKNPNLHVDESVFESEKATSERNHSLAWELKRLRLLTCDVQPSLEFYTRLCSVAVTAEDLAEFALVLAKHGENKEEEQILKKEDVTTTLSLMLSCGLYNGSGSFIVEAGLPVKSGVGGGIIAVVPGKAGIATFGPSLDHNGNSIGGIDILKQLSHKLGWHILGKY